MKNDLAAHLNSLSTEKKKTSKKAAWYLKGTKTGIPKVPHKSN